MPLNNPRSGYNSVAEYQASGLPWVTSGSVTNTTQVHLEFPYATRAINIANNSANTTFLKIGFTQNGVSGTAASNCYNLQGGQQCRPEVRVRDLWLATDTGTINFCVLAELTTIERMHVLPLTGSISGTLGWGGVG